MTEPPNRKPDGSQDDLMARVRSEMEARGVTLRDAAAAIGVGVQTLEKHIAGEHVRSDSALKYRNWLEGRAAPQNIFVLPTRTAKTVEDEEAALPPLPARAHRVVDIFSGCGGLSLGFDVLGDGGYFRTILAVDSQSSPIAVLNRNAAILGHGDAPVGRRMDLTEFDNEIEFLTFFLEHAAAAEADVETGHRLDGLAGGALPRFRAEIQAADAAFLYEVNAARSDPAWQQACAGLDRSALGQTSVIGFHEQLRLPRTSGKPATLPAVLWAHSGTSAMPASTAPPEALVRQAEKDWDAAVAELSSRQEASGRGQLSASSRRVAAFVGLLESPATQPVRRAWARWRAARLELRAELFENSQFAAAVRALYLETHPVSVLVGGPPCQGFSRIGRGKIRSLREAMVHVQGDSEAGDSRNLLFRQYVMVLEALRPDVFLFENVQHFQSTVKADGVKFRAAEVLAEAIANVSDGEVSYGVAQDSLHATRHGVPQTRQRYFMCGVRADPDVALAEAQARDILNLPRSATPTLGEALAGLPDPDLVGGDTGARVGGEGVVTLTAVYGAERYASWVRRPPPGGAPSLQVDGHIARAPRADDAAFFALLGPGRRWMDYRADAAPTLSALNDVLAALTALPPEVLAALQAQAAAAGRPLPDAEGLTDLLGRADGSLPLRLLLEQGGEKLGQPNHLLAPTYLAKRDGHHGDWIARMDASKPAKTMVSHMGKDTYGYVHPSSPRTLSVREAARIQTFPDWFSFGDAALTDAFRMVGNAVPPLLSHAIAGKVAAVLAARAARSAETRQAKR